jgi:hypothetical protein
VTRPRAAAVDRPSPSSAARAALGDEAVDVFEHGAARVCGKLLDLAQLAEQEFVLRRFTRANGLVAEDLIDG